MHVEEPEEREAKKLYDIHDHSGLIQHVDKATQVISSLDVLYICPLQSSAALHHSGSQDDFLPV